MLRRQLFQVPVFSQNNQNDVNAAIKTDTTSTWTENQESSHQSDDQNLKAKCERPHTISSGNYYFINWFYKDRLILENKKTSLKHH